MTVHAGSTTGSTATSPASSTPAPSPPPVAGPPALAEALPGFRAVFARLADGAGERDLTRTHPFELVRELADAAEGERSQVLLSSHSPFVIVDAWNGDARDFIYQCHPSEGLAKVSKFTAIVHDAGALRAGGGLGLRLAEEVMDGFRHQP